MDQTTQGLINLVKERETIPDSGAAYSESVLLNYLDQSLKGFIVPAVEATLEEHFIVTQDTQMPDQGTYNGNSPPTNVTNFINIPGESTGLRLRDVYLVGTDGSFYNLPRLTPTQAASQNFGNVLWGPGYNNQNQSIGGFFLQNNQVQIFPYGLASGKLVRITYQRAPADLCLTSAAGQVVNRVGDVVTIDKVQNNWFAGITKVNAISNELPHDYIRDPRVPTTVYTSYAPLSNMTIVGISGNVITLPVGTGANIQIGDWICPKDQSVFAQNIPKELLPVLVQKAAEMCLEAAGDRDGQTMANKTFNSMMALAIAQIAPRVIGKPIKILPTNSAFKAARGSNWGRV
jgi:hypothetical protein